VVALPPVMVTSPSMPSVALVVKALEGARQAAPALAEPTSGRADIHQPRWLVFATPGTSSTALRRMNSTWSSKTGM
jgi:hypothetical protein